jgi:hypothetical protein
MTSGARRSISAASTAYSERPSAMALADLAVDLDALELPRVDPRGRHHRQALHLRRIRALVRAADEGVRQAEAGDDLSGRWEQRDDPHRSSAAT